MKIKWLFKDARSAVLIVVLTILCLASIAGNVYLFLTRDQSVISNDSLREEIVPVAELTTYDYNFTQILFLTDAGNPLNINNPITSKRYVATIDGTVPIKLDASKIECQGTFDPLGRLVAVKVVMPHSYIGEVTLLHETAKKYVEDNGFLNLNQVSTDDINTLYVQAEKEQRQKLEDSGVVDRADQRAQEIISSQIHNTHGEHVNVTFEFIE